MKYLSVFIVFTLCVLPCYAQQEEDYITVSFQQTATPNVWTNDNLIGNIVDVDVDVDVDRWNTSSTRYEDRGNDRYRIETDYRNTRTTTTTDTTSIDSQTAVFLTVSFLDMVNAQGAFESNETFQNSWFQQWDDDANRTTNRTFQIREDFDRDEIVRDVQQLNTMYTELFDLQNRIQELLGQCDAYIDSPAYDREQPSMMDDLAKLRKEEYALKGEIIAKRSEVYGFSEGTGRYGWVTTTRTDRDIDTTTSQIVTSVTETISEHGICFVAETSFADGTTIDQVTSLTVIENDNPVNGNVAETGFYSGIVFMFYDAAGRPLLPGAVTPNHRMVCNNAEKSAALIEVGDMLVRGTNEEVRVARIELELYQGYTYNIANDCNPFSFTDKEYVVTLGVSK